MAELVRCKSCGYVMEAKKLKDRCPACGVAAKMFEPYDDKTSDVRRRILGLHIHPVIVHAPQAFAFLLVVLAAALFFATGQLRAAFMDTMLVVTAIQPFAICGAFCAGLLDGKIRFRRVTTPILIRKIFLGVAFFVFSLAMAFVVFVPGIDTTATLVAYLALAVAALGSGTVLGLLGSGLLVAKFPG